MLSGLFTAFDALIAARSVLKRFRAPAVNAALDRDRSDARLGFERAQLEEERRRAEAARELDVRRKAVDRELSRLRLVAGAALMGWIASIVALAIHAGAGSVSIAARVATGAGWLLLLGAMAMSFTAQSRVIAREFDRSRSIESDALPMWLMIAGLGISASSLLV